MEKNPQRSFYLPHRSNSEPGIQNGIGKYNVIRWNEEWRHNRGWENTIIQLAAFEIFALNPDHAANRARKIDQKRVAKNNQ